MKDTYTIVTDRIIAELETDTVPWHKPWTCAQPAVSHTTSKAYSLLNQLLLGGRGGEYLTFKQVQKEGGRVKKGEKSSIVVFWKWLAVEDEDTGAAISPFFPSYRTLSTGSSCTLQPDML